MSDQTKPVDEQDTTRKLNEVYDTDNSPIDPQLKDAQIRAISDATEYLHKWAWYFATNGTGYIEHLPKDNEAIAELLALITQEREAAQREFALQLKSGKGARMYQSVTFDDIDYELAQLNHKESE